MAIGRHRQRKQRRKPHKGKHKGGSSNSDDNHEHAEEGTEDDADGDVKLSQHFSLRQGKGGVKKTAHSKFFNPRWEMQRAARSGLVAHTIVRTLSPCDRRKTCRS